MIIDQIYDYLKKEGKKINQEVLEEARTRFSAVTKRQFMKDSGGPKKGKIYPSSMGKECPRQLAYSYHGFPKDEPLQPRAKLNFYVGDLIELGVLALAKLAGCDIGLNNEYIKVSVDGFDSNGFVDGLFSYNDKMYVIEVKSQSSYSFRRFEKEGFSNKWGYLTQLSLYLDALDLDEGIFLVVDKNTGKLAERRVKKDEEAIEKAKENVRTILASSPETLPPRYVDFEDVKWMTRKKCWDITKLADDSNNPICQYCQYTSTCWGEDLVKKEMVSGKPHFRIYKEDLEEGT